MGSRALVKLHVSMGEFLMNNLALVALFLASGAMLVWPEVARLVGASNELGTLEVTRLINQGPHLVLDVRDNAEYAAGHVPKARNIPVRELARRVDEIAKYKDKPVIVTCKGNASGAAACRFLKGAGFNKLYQLRGGIAAWEQASLPVEK
jgi:rhodanese-related sulfurtransferase